MPRVSPPTHPRQLRQLAALGERLRAARLRRKLTQAMVAERVGVTVPTYRKLESGDPSTSLATVVRVLQVLGLGSDIDALAASDPMGRELQDRQLRQPRRRSAPAPSTPAEPAT